MNTQHNEKIETCLNSELRLEIEQMRFGPLIEEGESLLSSS